MNVTRVIGVSLLVLSLSSCAQPTAVQVEPVRSASAKDQARDWAKGKLEQVQRDAVQSFERELNRQLEEVQTPSGTVPNGEAAKYDRDEFGPDWYDVDNNDCSTRDDQLAQHLTNVVVDEDNCTVLAGTLQDNYTAATYEYQRGHSVVDLDHIVPLALAWDRGADRWTYDVRVAFANDPQNLELTYMGANRSKSDRGPEAWMPPNTQYHCTYLKNYVRVLRTYRLSVTPGEAAMTREACA